MNMMIIKHDNGQNEFNICPCGMPHGRNFKEYKDEPITEFYSYRQARDNGWLYVYDPRIGEKYWLCPACVKEPEKKIIKN